MTTNNNINYETLAYRDIIALVSDQIKEDEFIKRYMENATKSHDYAKTIQDAICSRLTFYDISRAKSIGIPGDVFVKLHYGDTVRKIIPALFKVAYTRTPTGKRTNDAQPESDGRRRNVSPAAINALQALSSVPSVPTDSVAIECIYDGFFYPRKTPLNRRTGMIKPEFILGEIRKDFEQSRADYARTMKNITRE